MSGPGPSRRTWFTRAASDGFVPHLFAIWYPDDKTAEFPPNLSRVLQPNNKLGVRMPTEISYGSPNAYWDEESDWNLSWSSGSPEPTGSYRSNGVPAGGAAGCPLGAGGIKPGSENGILNDMGG